MFGGGFGEGAREDELRGCGSGAAACGAEGSGEREAGLDASGGRRGLPDQHRRRHLPAPCQHPWHPQGHPRAPREAVRIVVTLFN